MRRIAPDHGARVLADGATRFLPLSMATTDGSRKTTPRPLT
jgi:hypothetical protein